MKMTDDLDMPLKSKLEGLSVKKVHLYCDMSLPELDCNIFLIYAMSGNFKLKMPDIADDIMAKVPKRTIKYKVDGKEVQALSNHIHIVNMTNYDFTLINMVTYLNSSNNLYQERDVKPRMSYRIYPSHLIHRWICSQDDWLDDCWKILNDNPS